MSIKTKAQSRPTCKNFLLTFYYLTKFYTIWDFSRQEESKKQTMPHRKSLKENKLLQKEKNTFVPLQKVIAKEIIALGVTAVANEETPYP